MNKPHEPEVWLRGPLNDIPALLQPVAHALLQARNEVNHIMQGFPEDALWDKLPGLASVGFHLQHLTGVLNRLFTYAQGSALNQEQLQYLGMEGENTGIKIPLLLEAFNKQIDNCITQLKLTPDSILTEYQAVGRAQLPSTVIGLLGHAAEHTMRHTGQLLVTVRVLHPS